MGKLKVAALLIAAFISGLTEAAAQGHSTRFGIGLGGVVNPSNPEVSDDDLGLDFRMRISQPVTGAMSVAADVGAFVFNDEDRTEYVINPQVLLITTLGGETRFPYFMVGIGAVLPAEQEKDSQIEVNAGYGWAWPFGSTTSVFVEINPMLAFRTEGVAVLVPLRGGLIF